MHMVSLVLCMGEMIFKTPIFKLIWGRGRFQNTYFCHLICTRYLNKKNGKYIHHTSLLIRSKPGYSRLIAKTFISHYALKSFVGELNKLEFYEHEQFKKKNEVIICKKK